MGLLDFLGFGSKKINVKRVENENGENLIYHEDGNIVHFKYFKKDGKIDGKFYSNYLNGVVCDTLSFKNGLLHGECTEYSISGGTIRTYEKYDEGYLIHKKVFFTGSNAGKLANELKYKKGEFKEGDGNYAWFKGNFEKDNKKYKF